MRMSEGSVSIRTKNLEPVLEALLSNQQKWASHGAPDLERVWEIATMAGLDAVQARRDATSAEIDSVLRFDMADARANKIQQTPTFFVNKRPLTSFGAQQLYDLVDEGSAAREAEASLTSRAPQSPSRHRSFLWQCAG